MRFLSKNKFLNFVTALAILFFVGLGFANFLGFSLNRGASQNTHFSFRYQLQNLQMEYAKFVNSKRGVLFPIVAGSGVLVLDLNKNDLQIDAGERASNPDKFVGTAHFDWDNNDFAESTDWLLPGETFLVVLQTEEKPSVLRGEDIVGGLNNSYQEDLSKLDDNEDGKITTADSAWRRLFVWEVINADALAQEDELKPLSAWGLTEVNFDWGYALNSDGVKYKFDIFKPRVSKHLTRYSGDYTLSFESFILPNLRGYGTIPDLHISMNLDSDLIDLLRDFCALSFKDYFLTEGARDQFEELTYLWGGVAHVDPDIRGEYIDARKLAFQEKYYSKPVIRHGVPWSPDQESAKDLNSLWDGMRSRFSATVYAQCLEEKLWSGQLVYDVPKDRLSFDGYVLPDELLVEFPDDALFLEGGELKKYDSNLAKFLTLVAGPSKAKKLFSDYKAVYEKHLLEWKRNNIFGPFLKDDPLSLDSL